MLHLLGACPNAGDYEADLRGLEALAKQIKDLFEQLNDSMFEELVRLVLDVMGHLGVRQ